MNRRNPDMARLRPRLREPRLRWHLPAQRTLMSSEKRITRAQRKRPTPDPCKSESYLRRPKPGPYALRTTRQSIRPVRHSSKSEGGSLAVQGGRLELAHLQAFPLLGQEHPLAVSGAVVPVLGR